MKRKLINSIIISYLFLFVGVFFSCNGTKHTIVKNENILVSNSNQSISNLSARTKQFLNEF